MMNNPYGQYDWQLQQNLIQQSQQSMQQDMMVQQARMMGYKPHKPTRKEFVDYLTYTYNASEVVAVEEFDTIRTRHICNGGKEIHILDKRVCPINTDFGVVNAEVFFCPLCRKLIYNKSSIEI